MNILQALDDPNLFQPFLGTDQTSWANWRAALACLYGLPVAPKQRQTIRDITGRKCGLMPTEGFNTALFLTGRRSGKSRIAAVIAAFEAALTGREKMLAPGEIPMVPVISPTRFQSQIVHSYIKGVFASAPLLAAEVAEETNSGFRLNNGVHIAILTGDHKAIRGFTILGACVDESAFFATSEESKCKSDTELMRALKPGLSTTKGRLIAITSPYAKKGWTYSTYDKNHGNDAGKTLVVNAPSRVMNPTLDEQVVADALAEDLAAGKSEYLGEFRDDILEFLPLSLIESLVVKDRKELLPRRSIEYHAFCDISGGRGDDAALAIGHREGQTVVMDVLRRYRPPMDPRGCISDMCRVLKEYSVRRVTGDAYGADFVSRAFQDSGINHAKSEKPKSAIFLEFVPRACSGQVQLLDDPVLVKQLGNLERKVRSGGKDTVDHPRGMHDDLANVAAGVCAIAGTNRRHVGAL